MAKIEHLFVLMLENRSFDHLLGFSGLPGVPQPPAQSGFTPGAVDQLANDPPHEFPNVKAQIDGGKMDGFAASGGPDTMMGFDVSEVPVLIELAKNNLYFDNWYSSMPGPTWPNRLFAHAGSSGGLDNSLSSLDSWIAVVGRSHNLNFENGHIFDRLTAQGVSWRIYHHHGTLDIDFPQVLCLKGMVDKRNDPTFFRHFSELASDISRGDVAHYTFIEPQYGLPSCNSGNSQHPTGSISMGEILMKDTHDAIFSQPVGDNSALLITWDEHGGFFDHVVPPAATPPGDQPLNQDRASDPQGYTFDRFGVRVPAVLISRWLPAGRGSDIFGGNTQFDHASIVKALRSTFSLGPRLTNRDDAAPDWNSALLANARALTLALPAVAKPELRALATLEAVAAQGAPSGNVLGMAQIAADIDWHIAERLRVQPLIVSEFGDRLAHARRALARPPRELAAAEQSQAHLSVLQYIQAVAARDARLQPPRPRKPRAVKKKAAAKPRSKPSAKKAGAKSRSKPPAKKRSTRKRSVKRSRRGK